MKKKVMTLLIIFSFFFMKNNVFAETKTCKYSLANATRKVVAFDDLGNASLDSRAQSQISSMTDQNLVMTVITPDSGNVSSLTMYLQFSVEGDKFSIDKVTAGPNASGPYDIYSYTINGDKKAALEKLKECPELGVLYNGESSDKYRITNITLHTDGSNIKNLVNVYTSTSCTNKAKILCYYGDRENDYQGDKLGISYEILANKGTMGLYKMVSTVFKVESYTSDQAKSNIRISDFKCSSNTYKCPDYTYYTYDENNDVVRPVTYNVKTSVETRQIPLYKSYHISGSIYFMPITLYNKETNSGTSGNPTVPGTYGYCKLNPNTAVCKEKYKAASSKPFKFCDDAGVLRTLKIVNIIITVSKILVPILLVIYGSIEYGKASLSGDSDAVEKTTQLFIKKVIVGLLIFFIPTIINSIISFSQSDKDKNASSGEFKKCALCFAGDKTCNYYIKNPTK